MSAAAPRPTATRAFVDAVEGATARLVVGDRAFDVPRTLLPPGVREGAWIEIAITEADAPPDDTEARRSRLGRGDPGGNIKL